MKKQMLLACFGAVAVGGCFKKEVEEPVSTRPPEVVTSSPLATGPISPVLDSNKMLELPQLHSGKDGGTQPSEITPAEHVALKHEHRAGINHLEEAKRLREQGDLDEALVEARRAVDDSSNDEEALTLVSNLGRKTHNLELAVDALSKLAELRPDDAVVLIQQARLLMSLGRFAQAVDVGTESIRKDSSNVESYQVVGRAFLSLGQLSQATRYFEKAVELDPEHGYALNNLGFAYLRSNEHTKALEVLQKAAELLPHVAFVQNNLGVALERNGQREEAQLAYNHARDLSPKYVKAIINLKRVAQTMTPQEEPTPLEDTNEDVVSTPFEKSP